MNDASSTKVRRASRGRDARGVIVTAAGPHMRSLMHDVALPSFQSYADRWRFDLRAVDLGTDGVLADALAQRAKWAKVALVREALLEFPLVIWLDADVLIARTDDDIVGHLHPQHFQALALENVPAEHRVNPNTGVWLMRSCPTAFEFLDAVEKAGQQPCRPKASHGEGGRLARTWARSPSHLLVIRRADQ